MTTCMLMVYYVVRLCELSMKINPKGDIFFGYCLSDTNLQNENEGVLLYRAKHSPGSKIF